MTPPPGSKTTREHIAIRDRDGQPIPGIPDGIYDVAVGETVVDGNTVSYQMTLTPVNPPRPTTDAYDWLENL